MDNNNTKYIYYQLCDGQKNLGGVDRIRLTSEHDVGDLRKAIHSSNTNRLGHIDTGELCIYESGTTVKDYHNKQVLEIDVPLSDLQIQHGSSKAKPLLVVVSATFPPAQWNQQEQEDNILGEGVYEKLTGAVCFFRENEGERSPIGTGFAVSDTTVYTVAHNFAKPAVDMEVTCYFGKPNHQATRRLKISRFDTNLDYCILSIVAGEVCLPDFLEISTERLKTGRQCILAAFQIGIQQDLQYLDPDLSVGIFKGDIAKLYPRHFVYQCPSFAGDSGGAVVLKNGKVIGIHQETVIQARERIQHGIDMDADARLESVEASLDELIQSLSSGSIGLQLSTIAC